MSTMLTLEKWQTDYLDLVKKVEEPVVKFTGRMAGTLAPYVPERPTVMGAMPPMADLVENGLKFRKRMLDQNMQFVRHMLKALHPMIEKFETLPVVEPAKPAPKDATHQPASRTAGPPRRMTKVA